MSCGRLKAHTGGSLNPTVEAVTSRLRPRADRQRRHRAASLVEQATKAAAKDAPSITTAKKSRTTRYIVVLVFRCVGARWSAVMSIAVFPSDGHKNLKVPITPSGLFLEQVRQPEAAPKNLAKPSPYLVQTLWRLP
jgi:hypothetical protein